ncbi:MAG: hypothetical protein ACXWBN_07710, partial [Acidimicrobiales bacterium]
IVHVAGELGCPCVEIDRVDLDAERGMGMLIVSTVEPTLRNISVVRRSRRTNRVGSRQWWVDGADPLTEGATS